MSDLAAGAGEELETGFGRATPAGDNLLLDYARAEADAFAAIGRARRARESVEGHLGLHMCDLGLPTPFGNTVHLTRPVAPEEAEAFSAATTRFFAGRDGGPYMVFSPWPTADLTPLGFSRVGHPPFMVRPPAEWEDDPGIPDLEVVQVGDEAGLESFERVLVEAFPIAEMQPVSPREYLAPGVLNSAWRFLVGYRDGEAVATSATFVGQGVNVVEFVSVRPECRGRGFGAAITAAATRAEPELPAALISSDDGNEVYRRLGYLPLLRYTLWLGHRPESAA